MLVSTATSLERALQVRLLRHVDERRWPRCTRWLGGVVWNEGGWRWCGDESGLVMCGCVCDIWSVGITLTLMCM
eukprot:COSAG01_NODE_58148_length_307_cov_12.605769_1_plen_73_part_01